MNGTYNNGILLLDEAEMHARIDRRLDSRDWWVFALIGGAWTDLVCAVHEAHYGGGGEADFELILGPVPLFDEFRVHGVALAHKRRMDADALAAILGRGDHAEALRGGQDIVLVAYLEGLDGAGG